ncbi:MAG TPA: AMP-binding protein [Actinomycetota bacterium]|nr:AMP-binding protein [Actinomycetota bacterium]
MDLLTAHAASQPGKAAAVADGAVLTYAQLEERSNRLANALLAQGVASGDKCSSAGHNSLDQFVVSAATRKMRAVGVPMNYRLKPAEIRYQLRDSESVAVFCGPELVEAVDSVRAECPLLRLCVSWGQSSPPHGWRLLEEVIATGAPEPPPLAEGGLLGPSMTYTAGTTGNPKGAYRASGSDPSVVLSYIAEFGLRADDVHLIAGPLYHSAPAIFAAITLVLGGTNVVMPRFDPERALELIAGHGCTSAFMAPTLLQRIVDLPAEVLGRYDVSSMRCLIMAAAPCPYELKRRVMQLFGQTLYEFYGSSESGMNTLIRPHEQLAKPGSCGRVTEGVEIEILDEQAQQCPRGVPGEIWIKSPALITEYYRRPQETEASRRGEFFTVGDVGYLDDDGYLYIVDRKRDMIISGGVNIYSAEVESAIHSHPGVSDVAVIGVPDDQWGESVHAIVQPAPGADLTSEQIQRWVGERLADYKRPRSVEFRQLPRDLAGKIRKRELREPYWQGREARV